MAEYSSVLAAWQAGSLGRAVVGAEAQLLAEVCDDVFGLELLQIGCWGRDRELLASSRVRRQTLIAATYPAGQRPDIVASAAGLPVGSGAIDAVVLPHSLEIEPDPRAVLREAERVLVGEGQLIVLGFRPLASGASGPQQAAGDTHRVWVDCFRNIACVTGWVYWALK